MKAPVGLLSDRTVLRSKMEGLCPDKFAFVEQTCLWGRRDRLIMLPAKKNRAFPTGNALLYISLSSVDFSGYVLFRGAPCFCFIEMA